MTTDRIVTNPDAELQGMINAADNKLKAACSKIGKISNPGPNTAGMITQLNISLDELGKRVKEEQEWLKVYFSKRKSKRRGMLLTNEGNNNYYTSSLVIHLPTAGGTYVSIFSSRVSI